jgi:hypothetical protein
MNIELACCESVIENEIEQGMNQTEIAQTYAMAIVSSWPTDWVRVHAAIEKRWSKAAIERVKTKAWKLLEERQKAAIRSMAERN